MDIQEIRYQVGEAWKGTYDSATVYGNAAVVQDPTGLSVYRSLKSGNAGHPLTDPQWWFRIIDMSSIKQEADHLIDIDTQMSENEAARVAAESERISHENARINAETARINAENARANAESARVQAESNRVTQENLRINQEQARMGAEQQRVAREQQRVNQEASRVAAETQRQLNENNRQAVFAEDHAVAVADHQQADSDHTRAEQDHEIAVQDNAQMTELVNRADADHVQAAADHTTAAADHDAAVTDHATATSDHTTAASDHTRAEADHTASAAATAAANEAASHANALQESLENGTVIPAVAENIKSWADESLAIDNVFADTIRTTAGEDPIDTEDGGKLLSIKAKTDFLCTALLATAENQLRLRSNNGGAVAVGAGWYFPVPKLTLGQFGTADENNGLILVDSNGNNITTAAVYFKPLADGVPASATDGTEATSTNVTFNGKTYKVYTTSGPGYLIVSDITYADTCARIAWEEWYDRFVSPTDPADIGGSIALSSLFTAAPNGTGKFLVCGRSATYAERISASQWRITDPVGRIAEPAWVNTEVIDPETQVTSYLHSLVISDVATGGTALIEGSQQSLSVEGTTVSYTDDTATAITGALRYEKATPATATISLDSAYALNDVGIEMKEGAEGEADFICEYSQNVADTLAIVAPSLNTLRHDAAVISLGYGVCSTDTYAAAKTVTIPNFMLLQNGTVNVLFTTPINVEHATLNVSNTGAKPIRILGQDLPAGVIKAQTYATMAYDGTAWNILNLFCPDASFDPAGLLVDMDLPSGVKWAARDIDITKPGGFCDTPFTYMKTFFSWGNIDGHNPTRTSSFNPWNWGGVNEQVPYYEGQVYGTTPGNTLTASFAPGEDFDAARANLGTPWRMPTSAEFGELFANIRYINADGTEVDTTKTDKRVTVNGVVGLYLESKNNGARLFFSASGYGTGRSWSNRGSSGFYWSSTWNSARYARFLYFFSSGVNPQNYYFRYVGFPVRPVQ